MSKSEIMTSEIEDTDVFCYGCCRLVKGCLADENGNTIVDENGNNIFLYGIVNNED